MMISENKQKNRRHKYKYVMYIICCISIMKIHIKGLTLLYKLKILASFKTQKSICMLSIKGKFKTK